MFRRLSYTFGQAFRQLGRNKGTNFIAIIAITSMMMVLGIFFIIFVNVDLFANEIKDDYNMIEVYMKEGVKEPEISNIKEELKSIEGVSKVEYRSKIEALRIMKKRWGKNAYLLDNLESNPLPDSYLVYVESKEYADKLSKLALEIKGVEDIKYYQDTVSKLAKITKFITISSIIMMAFLVLVSTVIIANTIKLTVLNRSKEIAIMKYLGATDWFVRGPFLIEGIIIGLISSGIGTGLIYLIYKKIISIIGADIMRMLSVPIVNEQYLIYNILIIFLAIGVGVGTCGSIISIRRFLDR